MSAASLTRRGLLAAGAAVGATALVAPEQAFARAANSGDWTLAFADVEADVAPHAMRLVHGRPPARLKGVLYRNGPGKFRRPGGAATHWFDGDGLIRRFAIDDGRAQAAARFADTHKRRVEAERGAMVMPGFGTRGAPDAPISSNDDVNAANTSVMAPDGKLWALWEGGSALELDPGTLETRGFVTLRPDLKSMPFSAHPRYEPDGRVWNFGLYGRRAVIWRLSRDGALEAADIVDLPQASFFHDFTATDRHLVIVLQPWVRGDRMVLPVSRAFQWRPELGTKVLVVDKADLSRRRVFDLPAFSFFHLGDAWEEGDGTIRFDVCASDDPTFGIDGAEGLLLGRLAPSPPARLARIALHPDGRGRFEPTGTIAEFPKGDPRFAGRARALTFHVWGEAGRESRTPLAQGVASSNHRTGAVDRYDFGLRHLAEEPIFTPRPGSTAEGDGWLLATTVNLDARATELHVFDARRIAAGPIATWRAGVALPATFHGTFVS